MLSMRKLSDCGIQIIGGQIMSRVTLRAEKDDKEIEARKVLMPKCIHGDGTITAEEMTEEFLRVPADPKKLAQDGDIIMKLSPPYDAGLVSMDTMDAIVPSFCAILRSNKKVDPYYLLAFLNSDLCKNQLRMQVSGALMTVLSVGKLGNIEIPVPSSEKQHAIGSRFVETSRRMAILQKIAALEAKRNRIVFKELIKDDNGRE